MPIGELHPYENNPRINDDAVGYVANSISEFGFKVPVIIDRGGGCRRRTHPHQGR